VVAAKTVARVSHNFTHSTEKSANRDEKGVGSSAGQGSAEDRPARAYNFYPSIILLALAQCLFSTGLPPIL